MKALKSIGIMGITLLFIAVVVLPAGASVTPDTATFTLAPGASVNENKDVCIPAVPARADVLFSFDRTGSMYDIIDTAKSQGISIMTDLEATGVDINYGVSSHMDYPDVFSSCGFYSQYGDSYYGDLPYILGQPITADTAAVNTAINGLTIGGGADGPEDYTRVFYESYSDPATGWRAGAKKVVVHFGDNVPHDCDLNEGVPGASGVWSTGKDPGRDATVETSDDLDFQTVLNEMKTNNVMLIECHSESDTIYWPYWTGITGGKNLLTSSATLPDDVVTAVTEGLTTPTVSNVHFVASTGFESWISSTWTYSGATDVCENDKVVTITVPAGTAPGDYSFIISAVDDAGVSYGDQTVTVTVTGGIQGVKVDIKPGSCPNSVNRNEKGVLPVAIVGTATFDVTTVDPATVTLNGIAATKWEYRDTATPYMGTTTCGCTQLGSDGNKDLIVYFTIKNIAASLPAGTKVNDSISLPLTGTMKDGNPIEGNDCIRIVK